MFYRLITGDGAQEADAKAALKRTDFSTLELDEIEIIASAIYQ